MPTPAQSTREALGLPANGAQPGIAFFMISKTATRGTRHDLTRYFVAEEAPLAVVGVVACHEAAKILHRRSNKGLEAWVYQIPEMNELGQSPDTQHVEHIYRPAINGWMNQPPEILALANKYKGGAPTPTTPSNSWRERFVDTADIWDALRSTVTRFRDMDPQQATRPTTFGFGKSR